MAERETVGQRLSRARSESGLSVPELASKILIEQRKDIGKTTILDTEKDKTPNPGIKTVETIAVGLGLDPLEVIGLALDDSPETESGFKVSQFARLWQTYSKLDKQQQMFVDDYVQMLIQRITRPRRRSA